MAKGSKKSGRRLGAWVKKCGAKWRKFKCSPGFKRKGAPKSWRSYMKRVC